MNVPTSDFVRMTGSSRARTPFRAVVFGNLIALPLQSEPRRRGNSVFVDSDPEPHAGPVGIPRRPGADVTGESGVPSSVQQRARAG